VFMSENKINNIPDQTEVKTPADIPMTPWYDPSQLLQTALQVMVSGLFTQHADRRAFYTEWDNDKLKCLPDQPFAKDELWFDFVADTGDGGSSTYAVVTQLLSNEIKVGIDDTLPKNADLAETCKQLNKNDFLALPRGDALILGGDLVYPTANELEYKKKFINLFKNALPRKTQEDIKNNPNNPNRHVFAFPQNHDWYDSLASFSQIFCKVEDTFLDMKCEQKQSYAAVKLTHNWWIFGLDFALSGDIDELQFEYFKKFIQGFTNDAGEKISPRLNGDSNVIIIYPEPIWTSAAYGNPQKRGTYRFEQLETLIEKAIVKDITIRIAGDQHHYRRYSSVDNLTHLITCGSGGAFLHPTHGPEKINEISHVRQRETLDLPRRFRFKNDIANELKSRTIKPDEVVHFKTNDKQNFPNRETSYELSKNNILAFITKNPSFGILTGLSYFLIAWMVFVALHTNLNIANIHSIFLGNNKHINEIDFSNILQAAESWTWAVLLSPTCFLLMILILFAFYGFTKSFNPHYSNKENKENKENQHILTRLLSSGRIGLIHGIIHLTMVFLGYWLILWINNQVISYIGYQGSVNPIKDKLELIPFLIIGTLILIFGYLVGSLIMGIYLMVTLNLHRFINDFPFLHSNEAFSSLKIQDYKGFLRFRITNEKLEAFFIGIKDVPDEWDKTNENDMTKPTWEVKPGKPDIKPILYDYWTVKHAPLRRND
jgi:hypothetical protein